MSHFITALPDLSATLAQSADPYALTQGRTWSLVGAGLGLIGVVVGVVSLVRKSRGPRAAFTSLGAGVLAAAVGTWVVAAAEGGPGTGYGIVGGYIAVVIGLAAIALGTLTLARRTASPRA
ncbi:MULTISPECIES: DUF6223 family protein [unclassified Saccharothrix]|uniref:DUF6223 family protein n=1 Tax=unclassified Saccharothrix TaxID=2593673 RepID=UPI00307D5C18